MTDFYQKDNLKIAIVGNPNSGKSTVFNALTGLNQKVANFPGVTVEKRTGLFTLENSSGQKISAEVIDLPGCYSLYPKSIDEQIPFQVLCDPDDESHPDLVIVIADTSNLKRSLFLCSQVIDLKIPTVLALNMIDLAERKGLEIDVRLLSEKLGVTIIPMDARRRKGIAELKTALVSSLSHPKKEFTDIKKYSPGITGEIKNVINVMSDYAAFQVANNFEWISSFHLSANKTDKLRKIISDRNFDAKSAQARETLERYEAIAPLVKEVVHEKGTMKGTHVRTKKLDNILTHRIFGYLIFLVVLFIIFQAIFALASYPMDLTDGFFAWVKQKVAGSLPQGLLNDLLVNGIIAGLNGVVIFIPQIALLFAFIAILEDTGYMARVSFMMDKLLRGFGLNGKSVIPLISGVACAVPAIMSARTIQNRKERLITIMVTPLMSCSARLPVYTLLISLIIPAGYFYGVNVQGLVLFAMYLIGFLAAILAAWLMKVIIQAKEKSFFIMELPLYRLPRFSNIGMHILEKVKVFLFDAGKVIMAISIVLWVLSSNAPGNKFEDIEKKYKIIEQTSGMTKDEISRQIKSEKLESSYAGILGQWIEPAIRPLGFDWKIGIALITSFAAREVFVGTMSTIYSAGDEGTQSMTVREKMQSEINPDTLKPRYDFATGFSLMLFYAFAMQCMSTLAVVKRETRGWKWPLIQFAYMGALAYVASLIAYQLLK
jgi:ferrous iron transport protein B